MSPRKLPQEVVVVDGFQKNKEIVWDFFKKISLSKNLDLSHKSAWSANTRFKNQSPASQEANVLLLKIRAT